MSGRPLEVARAALRGERCWIVGGAVRDELLGLPAGRDLDLVIGDRVEEAARAVAREAGEAVAFSLSDEFGGWRVVSRGGDWQIDLNPLRGDSIEADLGLRDFTVNAIARPLEGGAAVDPLAGEADLRAGCSVLPPRTRSRPIRCGRFASCGWSASSPSRSKPRPRRPRATPPADSRGWRASGST